MQPAGKLLTVGVLIPCGLLVPWQRKELAARGLPRPSEEMPTIIATGDAPDAARPSLSPSRLNNNRHSAVAAALGRGYRNCNRLRLLALVASASIVLAVWTASSKPYREECKVSTCGGGVDGDGGVGRRPRAALTGKGRPPRVAVCFFGLARSLRWTLPSVQRRLLDVLKDGGMELETFVHTYVMREVCTGKIQERSSNSSWFSRGFVSRRAHVAEL